MPRNMAVMALSAGVPDMITANHRRQTDQSHRYRAGLFVIVGKRHNRFIAHIMAPGIVDALEWSISIISNVASRLCRRQLSIHCVT